MTAHRKSSAFASLAGGFVANALKSLVKDRRGATAVEFALIAAPFIAILLAILETCLVMFAQEVLQTATTQSARLIMTGQAQTQSLSSSQFKTDVCNFAASIFTCANIYV